MTSKKSVPFFLRPEILPRLPLLFLVAVFLLPVLLIKINYQIGLFFIAFYIAYWTVKVFESYYYVIRSYLELLAVNRRDFTKDEILLEHGKNIEHLIVVPIYTEPYDVIEENIASILENDYPFMERITVLLATE